MNGTDLFGLTVKISAFSIYPGFEPAKIHSSESMKATRVHNSGKIAVKRMTNSVRLGSSRAVIYIKW